MNLTQRSINFLRSQGWNATIIERIFTIPPPKRRKNKEDPFIKKFDAFGFGDILAFNVHRKEIALLQTTTIGNMQARIDKISRNSDAHDWGTIPNAKIFVHGWKKEKNLWQCRQIDLRLP